MNEYLWPARNVAEHAYCPRLFYLMEGEGIHLPSADTVKGIAVHRRVDRPSNGPNDDADDPDRPQAVRSLPLTIQILGLTWQRFPATRQFRWNTGKAKRNESGP